MKIGNLLPDDLEDPFATLIGDLCDLVEREMSQPDASASGNKECWIWAAACLGSLANIKVGWFSVVA